MYTLSVWTGREKKIEKGQRVWLDEEGMLQSSVVPKFFYVLKLSDAGY